MNNDFNSTVVNAFHSGLLSYEEAIKILATDYSNGVIIQNYKSLSLPTNSPKKWFLNKNHTAYFLMKDGNYSSNWTFDYVLQYSDSIKIAYNLSQEEIDQICKEIKDEQAKANQQYQPILGGKWWDHPVGSPKIDQSPLSYQPKEKKECDHDWKEYIGLNHTDTYCTKCSVKK